jgi:hypothetical protein
MTEYNFEPDYEAEWNNEYLTEDDWIWVILETRPADWKRYDAFFDPAHPEMTEEDKAWHDQFEGNIKNLFATPKVTDQGMIGRRYSGGPMPRERHREIKEKNLWGSGKREFTRNLYENNLHLPPKLITYLQSICEMPRNEELECYRKHDSYYADLTKYDLNQIEDECAAAALLFGLTPEFFRKYIELQDLLQNDRHPWKILTIADRFFLKEYAKAMSQHLDVTASSIYHAYKEAGKRCNWTGDFASYVNALYNACIAFKPVIIAALISSSIPLQYSNDGMAIKLYKEWITREKLWSIETAANLYCGADPKGKNDFISFGNIPEHKLGISGWMLEHPKTVSFIETDGTPEKFAVQKLSERTSLEQFIRDHIDSGDFTPSNPDGRERMRFRPDEIIPFFRKVFLNYQPLALFQALGFEGLPSITKCPQTLKYATPSAQSSQGSAKPKKRISELHQCIGTVVKDLGFNCTAAEAWNIFRNRRDEFECVQEIEYNEKKGEDAILWKSTKGIEQRMLKSRFIVVVSEFKNGKKRLHAT